jgi:hypothetical protein
MSYTFSLFQKALQTAAIVDWDGDGFLSNEFLCMKKTNGFIFNVV